MLWKILKPLLYGAAFGFVLIFLFLLVVVSPLIPSALDRFRDSLSDG